MTPLARFPTWMLRAFVTIPALAIVMPTTVGFAELELLRRETEGGIEHEGVVGFWCVPPGGVQ